MIVKITTIVRFYENEENDTPFVREVLKDEIKDIDKWDVVSRLSFHCEQLKNLYAAVRKLI